MNGNCSRHEAQIFTPSPLKDSMKREYKLAVRGCRKILKLTLMLVSAGVIRSALQLGTLKYGGNVVHTFQVAWYVCEVPSHGFTLASYEEPEQREIIKYPSQGCLSDHHQRFLHWLCLYWCVAGFAAIPPNWWTQFAPSSYHPVSRPGQVSVISRISSYVCMVRVGIFYPSRTHWVLYGVVS